MNMVIQYHVQSIHLSGKKTLPTSAPNSNPGINQSSFFGIFFGGGGAIWKPFPFALVAGLGVAGNVAYEVAGVPGVEPKLPSGAADPSVAAVSIGEYGDGDCAPSVYPVPFPFPRLGDRGAKVDGVRGGPRLTEFRMPPSVGGAIGPSVPEGYPRPIEAGVPGSGEPGTPVLR